MNQFCIVAQSGEFKDFRGVAQSGEFKDFRRVAQLGVSSKNWQSGSAWSEFKELAEWLSPERVPIVQQGYSFWIQHSTH